MKRLIIALFILATAGFILYGLLTVSNISVKCSCSLFNQPITIIVSKGVKKVNSSELAKYLNFTPTIPKGWKAIKGYTFNQEITIVCISHNQTYKAYKTKNNTSKNNTSKFDIIESLNMSLRNCAKYTTIDGINVYTYKTAKGIPLIFKKGKVWYKVEPINLSKNETVNVTKTLIEQPTTFSYKILVVITLQYTFKRSENVKPFIEKLFKHGVILPYPYNASILTTKNKSTTIQVNSYLDYVYVHRNHVTLAYALSVSKSNSTSAESLTYTVFVNESLNGTIPSNAKEMKLGSNTVWLESNKSSNVSCIKIYTKQDGLLVTIYASIPTTNTSKLLISNKYVLDFAKYFLNF